MCYTYIASATLHTLCFKAQNSKYNCRSIYVFYNLRFYLLSSHFITSYIPGSAPVTYSSVCCHSSTRCRLQRGEKIPTVNYFLYGIRKFLDQGLETLRPFPPHGIAMPAASVIVAEYVQRPILLCIPQCSHGPCLSICVLH
jgi:hypothetical protein